MKKFVGFMLGFLLVFSVEGSASATLITNGDFATGDFSGWDYAVNVTVNTGNVAVFDVEGGVGTARLYQNFLVGPSWDGINVAFDFKYNGGTVADSDFFKSFLRLEIEGAVLDEVLTVFKTTAPTTDGWQHVSADILFAGLSIDSTDPNARLTFVNSEHVNDWSWARLDNVAVNRVPDASIMLLLGSSLMGLAVFSRKSKKS